MTGICRRKSCPPGPCSAGRSSSARFWRRIGRGGVGPRADRRTHSLRPARSRPPPAAPHSARSGGSQIYRKRRHGQHREQHDCHDRDRAATLTPPTMPYAAHTASCPTSLRGRTAVVLKRVVLSFSGAFRFPSQSQSLGNGMAPGSPVGIGGALSLAMTSEGVTITTSSVRRWRSLLGLEELTQNRNIAQNRDLGQVARALVIQQPGNGEVLTFPQLDLGLRPAGAQRRDLEPGDGHAVGEVERRHLRCHLQANGSVPRDFRSEPKLDAELLERDRHGVAAARLDGRIRELPTGQEVCLLGRQGEQVRLRQGTEIALGDRRLDQRLDLLVTAVEQEADGRRSAGGIGEARTSCRRR